MTSANLPQLSLDNPAMYDLDTVLSSPISTAAQRRIPLDYEVIPRGTIQSSLLEDGGLLGPGWYSNFTNVTYPLVAHAQTWPPNSVEGQINSSCQSYTPISNANWEEDTIVKLQYPTGHASSISGTTPLCHLDSPS